ncbi:OLC1v1006793C1 [Oldenlandia corymbosa var. corymbosa]|uniref:OLC1v1006793C1 n=1 Tax=Oldenlandia corymbosa var. corymbosa TaxID=529605 RepID=A0AAV1DL84_OLDCO|nr:OLC1v1006793C1 [Oldenlandia corymbosa var. corymbosa]
MEISEKVKKLIDDELKDLDDSSEKISEAFTCCVCLDLLYKPIVLACGHVSCFWCVHKSMSGLRESHCPICRNPYHHFPTICQMLHFILLKMYPISYKRREIQISEFEREADCFSPQLEDRVCKGQTEQEACHANNSQMRVDDTEASSFVVDHGDFHPTVANGTCQTITVDDALCTFCNQLVYHPVVLNCGHVFCESCTLVQKNEMIKCAKCEIAHPGRIPKVCLELDNFLEEQFPTEYALRKSSVQLKQSCGQQESPSTCSAGDAKESSPVLTSSGGHPLSWWGDHKVHIAAGCDSCGMFPIIGDRYKCKDCVEAIGFDLCGDCYNTRSKLPGRFNQQHTPEHQFELMRPNSIRNIMWRLLRDVSSAPSSTPDTPESGVTVVPSLSDDARESAESGFVTPSETGDTEEDQSNDHEEDSM